MVDAESILDLIPSKQKRWIPKLGDTNGANRFNSCPDYKSNGCPACSVKGCKINTDQRNS